MPQNSCKEDAYYTTFSGLFLWDGLASDEIRAIYQSLPALQTVQKGECLYSKTHFDRALCLLLAGTAVVTVGDEAGKPTIMRQMQAGDVFGAAALFSGETQFVSLITATADIVALFIKEAVLQQLFETYPPVACNYIRFLTGRIRFLNRRIDSFAGKTAAQRLHTYLLAVAEPDGTVTLRNMRQLSRVLSIGRTSLYRAMDTLKAENRLREENGRMVVSK